jgi:putative flippase GtrA
MTLRRADVDLGQILRYGAVGLVNTGFSFSLYLLLVWLGLHFAMANLLSLLAGIVFSFRTQGRWVFGHRDWGALRRYVPVWSVCYALNVGLIAIFVRSGLDAYSAGALALLPTVIAAYVLQRKFVFVARKSRGRT